MKKIGIIVFVLFILVNFMSCDWYSKYQLIIDNKTNDTVKIYFAGQTAYVNGTDSVISEPSSRIIFVDTEGIRNKKWECSPRINPTEYNIKISNKKTLKKDITDKNNWRCESDKGYNNWKMTFMIEETDLE